VQDTVVDATTFTDVEGWAKSYIAIAQSQGLINGRNATTYDPSANLTGYEWEKIVLCALGYDAQIENLVGATWQASTAVLAGKVGLLNGLEADYDATKAITREQAAQIAYNGLKAYTVIYPTTINKIAKVTDTTLGELVFGLNTKYADSFDIFGAPVEKSITTTKGKVVTEVYSVAYEAVETYNDIAEGTKIADIIDDLADATDAKAATVKANLTVYVDGAKTTGLTTVGGRGVEVAAYALSGGSYRIVVVNTYVEVLSKTAYTAETKNSNGKVTAEAYFTLDKGTGKKNVYLAAEGFEIGDIVVYNVGDEANLDKDPKTVAVNAEAKTGVKGYVTTVSADLAGNKATTSKSYVKIDGGDTTYFDANAVIADNINKTTGAGNGYYSYIYDNYGHIIYAAKANRETVSEVGHLYVINNISYQTTASGDYDLDHLYNGTDKTTKANAQALVILYTEDTASVEIVNLAISQTADGTFKYLNKYGEAAGTAIAAGKGNITAMNATFAEYYVTEDGKYILTACDDADATVKTTAAGSKITRGTTDYNADSATTVTYLTITKNPYDFTDLKTTTDFENAVKKIEVKAVTKTGYKNLLKDQGAGYLEVAGGMATVGAILSKDVTTTLYDETLIATYTGLESENSNYSDAYKFVGTDGETNYLYTTKSPASTELAALDEVDAACTGTDGQAFTVNKVYKLYLYKGEVVGYTEIANVTYAQVNFFTNTYANVDIVAGDKDQNVEIGFAAAYDLNTNAKKAIADTKGDVLALYTTKANDLTTVVFAQVVKYETVTATYSRVGDDGVFYYAPSVDLRQDGVLSGAVNQYNCLYDQGVKTADITAKATNADGEPLDAVALGQTFKVTIAPTDNGSSGYNYSVVSAVLQAAE
jgi:hypothetical protein